MSISGPIDRLRKRYLSRIVETARAAKLGLLIVHIDTDGGTVFDARDMFKEILDQSESGPKMVAFVDYRAISAGAMIAYAHEELYVTKTASIGDIGVIFRGPEGEIKYAPEKIETVVRTLLSQAAEQRGWNRGILLKMTAHKQLLYRITLPDGAVHYVIGDDYPSFLAAHPEVDEDDPKQVIVFRGKDRLITLTGQEAVELGMATALVGGKEDLLERLGVDPERLVDYTPRLAERTAWWLAPFTPLLAGLAFLMVLFELKTPGVGLWALLGVVCGTLFLAAHFYLDLAENLEIVLLLLGLALLVAEVLTGAGGGLLGLFGAISAFTGLLLAFIPNDLEFSLDDPRFQDALTDAAWSTVLTGAIVAAGLIVFISRLKSSRLGQTLGVRAEITATSGGQFQEQAASLVGKTGLTGDVMRPSGPVYIDGEVYSARVVNAGYAAAEARVEVVAVEFGELIVRPLTPPRDEA